MVLVLGLIILLAAVVVGVAGVLANGGSAHSLAHGFAVFGYHVTGSTGTLFLYGLVVGALALFGLGLLLSAARRTSRLGRAARCGLEQSRDETLAVSKDRDDLIDQRETARTRGATMVNDDSPHDDGHTNPGDGRRQRHRLGSQVASRPATTTSADS